VDNVFWPILENERSIRTREQASTRDLRYDELLVDLLECLHVILVQWDHLPKFRGHVGALNGFHVQVDFA